MVHHVGRPPGCLVHFLVEQRVVLQRAVGAPAEANAKHAAGMDDAVDGIEGGGQKMEQRAESGPKKALLSFPKT